jgi:hypothetical protein
MHDLGGPYFSSARSTISIARSTPAQNPRGWASTTLNIRVISSITPPAGGFAGGRAVVVYPCHSSRAARNAATLLHI